MSSVFSYPIQKSFYSLSRKLFQNELFLCDTAFKNQLNGQVANSKPRRLLQASFAHVLYHNLYQSAFYKASKLSNEVFRAIRAHAASDHCRPFVCRYISVIDVFSSFYFLSFNTRLPVRQMIFSWFLEAIRVLGLQVQNSPNRN